MKFSMTGQENSHLSIWLSLKRSSTPMKFSMNVQEKGVLLIQATP
jgi:hypothetical protein